MSDQSSSRVLFLASQPFFEWRGSPIRLGFDVRALAENGYEVDFLTLPIGEEREIPGVRIIRVPNLIFRKSIKIGPSVPKLIFDVIMLFRGLGLIMRNRYQVIHGIEDAGAVACVLAGLARCKLVFEKHSDPASYQGGGLRNAIMWAYSKVEAWTIKHADAVIGTGPALAEQARHTNPHTHAVEISDIPSSLESPDDNEVSRIRSSWVETSDDVLILYVGSFASYQGIDLMFESMESVLKNCERARLVVIGGKPDEVTARQSQLDAAGVGQKVTFAGFIAPDVLPSYLVAADILLSPRVSGTNTPLKLLDYLKAGRLIVATDHEANRLILSDDTAILAPIDPKGFADAVMRAVNEPGVRESFSGRGEALLDSKYNYRVFKQGLADCYAKIGVQS